MNTLVPTGKPSLTSFLAKAKLVADSNKPRLLFGLDATGSRQATWELASKLQRDMFLATQNMLSVQVAYFTGASTQISASPWLDETATILHLMNQIKCRAGMTSIKNLINHARAEHVIKPIDVLVYVGDTADEENIAEINAEISAFAAAGGKAFFFFEGRAHDSYDWPSFQAWAKRGNGAAALFDANAPQVLSDLLRSAATYARGGLAALEKSGTAGARLLLSQLKK